ncbi:ATP-grasp fold amidoligase family protein [Cytobacillus sp. FSL R5-0596]|uniref:ATP-grasp fold amidoligase family protein n=1 Tax=Cytobacillus sp. FSL R5-0596 TaxID=2954696 RepID=UPI0030FB98FE
MKKIKKIVRKSSFMTMALYLFRNVAYKLNPEWVVKINFKRRAGYTPNLDNPKSFNEKLQWLKLYWRDPKASRCSDKYSVREYVKSCGYEHILNSLIGVYDNVNDINFDTLPNKFVLKATHGSGMNIICTDKSRLDIKKTKKTMDKWLKQNYYYHSFEWVYKDIKPRIICEKFIETKDKKPPKDYKLFCFDGIPKMLFVASNRGKGTTKFDFYDCNWELLNLKQHYPNSGQKEDKPKELEEMLTIASRLSEGFPQVRIDFFCENGEILLSEMTFFHFSGNQPFEPIEYDYKMGEWLQLPHYKV